MINILLQTLHVENKKLFRHLKYIYNCDVINSIYHLFAIINKKKQIKCNNMIFRLNSVHVDRHINKQTNKHNINKIIFFFV